MVWLDERTDEVIGKFGGRWDRVRKGWCDIDIEDLDDVRVIRLHPGQLDCARAFVEWIHNYALGDAFAGDKLFDMLLAGGRRSGKSAFMFFAIVAFAISFEGTTAWSVVPSENYLTEPCDYLEAVLPKAWYECLGAPHWTYYLPNGSRIVIRSAHVPRKLKQGKADFIAINEGQAVVGQSYDTLSASIVDTGGLIMTAANPPDVGDPGDWVGDLAIRADRGAKHASYFHFDPRKNPHIDQQALMALAEKYDAHTFDVQVLGMFLLRPDTVLHAWNRKENELPMPRMGDCTLEFTKHFEGRPFSEIVAVDVQSYPWIAAIRLRAYRNERHPEDMSKAYLWAIGESFIDAGDEVETATDLKSQGVDEKTTLMITDASCRWQQAQRDQELQPTKYRGKGSMDIFRDQGFVNVVPPDYNMDANPDIADRCRAANARIGTKAGQRFLFVDPDLCPRTVQSIQNWKTRPNGMPSRSGKAAHGGDALSYAVWRFFPRRGETNKVDVTTIKRFGGRDRLKGF